MIQTSRGRGALYVALGALLILLSIFRTPHPNHLESNVRFAVDILMGFGAAGAVVLLVVGLVMVIRNKQK